MEKTLNNTAAERFAAEFAACLAEVLTDAAGCAVTLTRKASPDLSKRSGEPVHFRLTVEAADRGECFVELDQAGVAVLGAKVLAQTDSAYRDEYAEVLQQTLAKMLPRLKEKLGAEYGDLKLSVERISGLVFGGMLVVPLACTGLGDAEVPILLYFSSRFHQALLDGGAEPMSSGSQQIDTRNLDLVMDIELNVSLRFGQRQMPLREVLELESGSVIELDRRVDEPVELLLDGKVIATGEAVIVDGNYGLRVTSVPYPIARI